MSRDIPSVQSIAQTADLAHGHHPGSGATRSTKVLIAAALIVFAIAHLIGGVMLHAGANLAAASHHMLAAD